ncbi:Hypothetical predicted protein [Olea europaea subsp. europaea]|uniref:Uncharacterized protein n=1 Tax=Olea europaea subsp. europaea TaxID=158383 RepID=A0A8S0PHU6_OLEEU|nr:Hypothetical predicted protein [Olea europaea subsp. europaea]
MQQSVNGNNVSKHMPPSVTKRLHSNSPLGKTYACPQLGWNPINFSPGSSKPQKLKDQTDLGASDVVCKIRRQVENEEPSGESNTVNEAVTVVSNEATEKLSSMFDSLTQIADKRGIEISMTVTFRKEKGHADECGKGKGPARHA